jgi:hypothetical protein
MTEEQARTKWCPMTRNLSSFVWKTSHEYITKEIENIGSCIASDCMVWRRIEIDAVQVSKVNTEHPEWTGQQCYDSLPQRGYCGLGGKP